MIRFSSVPLFQACLLGVLTVGPNLAQAQSADSPPVASLAPVSLPSGNGHETGAHYAEYDNLPKLTDASYYGNKNGTHSVARIIQQNCVICHSGSNPAGGLRLDTKRAIDQAGPSILESVLSGEMPHGRTLRWESDVRYGDQRLTFGSDQLRSFADKPLLSREDVATLQSWEDAHHPAVARVATSPQGADHALDKLVDKNNLPSATRWKAGTPDLVQCIGGFVIPPGDNDTTQNFILDPKEFHGIDRLISSIEVEPSTLLSDSGQGVRRVVHHAHVLLDRTGCEPPKPGFIPAETQERNYSKAHPHACDPGFQLSAKVDIEVLAPWFPGGAPTVLPDGIGNEVPACAKLVLQVHYVNNGKEPVTDNTCVGFKFPRAPIKQVVQHKLGRVESGFMIPKGAKNYELSEDFTVPTQSPIILQNIQPHMHQYGQDEQLIAEFPDGYTGNKDPKTGQPLKFKVVLDAKWDFEHQTNYIMPEPKPKPARPEDDPRYYPAGTVFHYRAHYKNDSNRAPDPQLLKAWDKLSSSDRERLKGTDRDPRTAVDVTAGHDSRNEMFQVLLGYTDLQQNRPASPATHLNSPIYDLNHNPPTLSVSGDNLQPGAVLKVNGQIIRDVTLAGGKITSAGDWGRAASKGGGRLEIAVLNPDGSTSEPVILDARKDRAALVVLNAPKSPDSKDQDLTPAQILAKYKACVSENPKTSQKLQPTSSSAVMGE